VALAEAAKGKTISEVAAVGNATRILAVLSQIEAVVAEVEPVKTVTRFGNPAFKVAV
jgi:hypothetical protein